MPNLEILILQISIIILTARLIGSLFRKLRQPQVVGEMLAGILLGPSVLGSLFPGISDTLFSSESLGFLYSLSYIGLLLFMFLIGLEVDLSSIHKMGRSVFVISSLSMIVPFLLGIVFAYYLHSRLSNETVKVTGFVLFMGVAMSITAFPVLARILTERNMLRTRLGILTIACAAINDVVAWVLVTSILTYLHSTDEQALFLPRLAGLAIYIGFVILITKFLHKRLNFFYSNSDIINDRLALIILMVLISSLITESLGIHSIIGAFLAGLLMPKSPDFVGELSKRFESVTTTLLLPLFFAFIGLRTNVQIVTGAGLWVYCVLIILIAVVGKFCSSVIAARIMKMDWQESIQLGVLMNTRGLNALLILNIGLEVKVISSAVFSMMVIMALFTTFITVPILVILEALSQRGIIRQSSVVKLRM